MRGEILSGTITSKGMLLYFSGMATLLGWLELLEAVSLYSFVG